MNKVIAILVLALISATALMAQGNIAETEQNLKMTVPGLESQNNGVPAMVAPTVPENSWQTRDAAEQAAKEFPSVKARIGQLEADWLSLQRKTATARRHGDVRMVRIYTNCSNRVSSQIISLRNSLSREANARFTADQRLAKNQAAETSARKLADKTEAASRIEADNSEATARQEGDNTISLAILVICLIAGLGFVINAFACRRA